MRAYLLARLAETSTWVGMGAVIGGAAAIPAPFWVGAVICGVIAILVPNKGSQP